MRRSPSDVRLSATRDALATLAAFAMLGTVVACHGSSRPSTAARRAPADSVQVGYGTQATRDVTGAISSVDGDVVRQTTATTMADMLEGRVPGLQVTRLSNGGVSVRIRGQRSLLKDGEPLYVIDGVPMQGGTGFLPDIDPREVRSIQVLKDAGSLAAYGSRGANGVILINMRKAPK